MFTKPNCPACDTTKQLFVKHNIPIDQIFTVSSVNEVIKKYEKDGLELDCDSINYFSIFQGR